MSKFSRVRFIEFLKPVAASQPPRGSDWIHEIKHDGYRTQLLIEDGRAAAFSKSGLDWTDRYPHIAKSAATLGCSSAIIDGEVVINDENGVSSFARLPGAIRREPHNLLFMAFDLLHLDGHDLRREPLLTRKKLLKKLLGRRKGPLRYVDHLVTDGASFFAACENLGLEGMVSKRPDSIYKSGPSKNWLKTKCYTLTDFDMIGTATTRQGERVALLRGRDTGEYAGTAFINLKREKREMLSARIRKLRASRPALKGTRFKDADWLKPGLVASVRHLRGEEGLRHASILDIRDGDEDVPAED
ncbi:putative DNA ligase-like protein [compost metagenome]